MVPNCFIQNHCLLNDPWSPELFHAFQFFKGIAYSGIGQPEDVCYHLIIIM